MFTAAEQLTRAHAPLVLAYIGPEVFLPLTSALAAAAGAVLLFWQKLATLFGKLFRRKQRHES